MTRDEAYFEMCRGNKVRHRFFTSDEYIYMDNDHIFTEDGYDVGTIEDEFWQDRGSKLGDELWLEDWEVVKNPTMKAKAKHDCSVTLCLDLNSISLNRASVKKGDVLEFPVFRDRKLGPPISEHLGDRSVTFIGHDGMLIPTYSRDFEYIEE